MAGWDAFKQRMSSESALVQVRIDKNNTPVNALIDSGCDCYAAISESLTRRLRLPLVDARKHPLRGYSEYTQATEACGVAAFTLETAGFSERIYAYVIPGLDEDLFLGKPWCEQNDVVYYAQERRLYHRRGEIELRFIGEDEPAAVREIRNARLVPASVFIAECHRLRKLRRQSGEEDAGSVMAISLKDIEKALKKKPPADPTKTVPTDILTEFPDLFDTNEAMKLPPHRPGIDHEVNLVRDSSGNEAPLPWGPLYNMSREELLVLRKTLNEYLDLGFIRASSSAAAAPVLFVKKPNGGLRFCCDYRALNAITKRDRYPLPLIAETLRSLTAARWFTKLDVVAAFHKLRVKEGDEHKTAFRTRFGSFEWLVCPFGLSGAPASFQRYINSVVRPFDDCATAYLDDVLIYTGGTREEHLAQVRTILAALQQAGLHLDPAKCEFGVTSVKYLGFIVTAGEGVSCDPDKLRAIREWAAPTSPTGVRSFLGFANYYRMFIRNFARIAHPLTVLTRKGAKYHWDQDANAAFEELKECFTSPPLLKQWDYDKETFIETDCSGRALGGTLSQVDEQGTRCVVAFHSKKLSPPEFNYPIHDKELLAIISSLRAWRAELIGCGRFTIFCDHRNLEYFMTKRLLTERQSRWVDELTPFDFVIKYIKGKENAAADALSRRDQDAPEGLGDERIQGRYLQMIPDRALPERGHVNAAETRILRLEVEEQSVFSAQPELQDLWDRTAEEDTQFQDVRAALQQNARSFPAHLQLKVQISDCALDALGRVTYRERLWVPGAQEGAVLRGTLIQGHHDAAIAGHPGRDATLKLIGRRFFWPGIAQDVRRFCRNCDGCGGATIWRGAKQGFLKPLPMPERPRSELAMDFMVGLPPTGAEQATNLLVIQDRLTKNVTLEAMRSIDPDACAQRFLECHVRFHGFPATIVSDRGSNWTSRFWRTLCALVGTKQLLSTAWHPQTDGGPERINQEIQTYLRAHVCYSQRDWGNLLPAAQLALNSRENAAIQTTPFFLEHGYHPEPIQVREAPAQNRPTHQREKDAKKLVERLQEATEFAQAALAAAQARSEEAANKRRSAPERYAVGDLVWLNIGNYRSPRPSKKLDWLHRKYRVTKVLGSHNVELDVGSRIWPRFHVDLLRRASSDPLPGQVTVDPQPAPLRNEDDELEFEVEDILCAQTQRLGRGVIRRALVRWRGYTQLNWEPVENLQDVEALDRFEERYGDINFNDGPIEEYAPATQQQRSRSGEARKPGSQRAPIENKTINAPQGQAHARRRNNSAAKKRRGRRPN